MCLASSRGSQFRACKGSDGETWLLETGTFSLASKSTNSAASSCFRAFSSRFYGNNGPENKVKSLVSFYRFLPSCNGHFTRAPVTRDPAPISAPEGRASSEIDQCADCVLPPPVSIVWKMMYPEC